MKIKWKTLAVCVVIPLAVGFLAWLLTRGAMEQYADVLKPPLSPPDWLFPIAWTVLYILMGVSSYLIYMTGKGESGGALTLYGIQLLVNFAWPLVYFGAEAFLAALIILLALWVLVLIMILVFHRLRPLAAWLQLPYIAWLTFAAYLNLGVYLLNR